MRPIRILVTGSRDLDEAGRAFVWRVLDEAARIAAGPIVVIDGAARGVDSAANEWAWAVPLAATERYPADWRRYGKRAGYIRNEHMVSLGADVCLAFPRRMSPGTWNCIYQAAGAGIPVRIYPLPELS